jgi:hypothetical protein
MLLRKVLIGVMACVLLALSSTDAFAKRIKAIFVDGGIHALVDRPSPTPDVSLQTTADDGDSDDYCESLVVQISGGSPTTHALTGVDEQPLFAMAYFEDGHILKFNMTTEEETWYDPATEAWWPLVVQE